MRCRHDHDATPPSLPCPPARTAPAWACCAGQRGSRPWPGAKLIIGFVPAASTNSGISKRLCDRLLQRRIGHDGIRIRPRRPRCNGHHPDDGAARCCRRDMTTVCPNQDTERLSIRACVITLSSNAWSSSRVSSAASHCRPVPCCCRHNTAYSPFLARSVSWSPCSTTFPPPRTMISSASRMVDSR
jgi:hypothetical protein